MPISSAAIAGIKQYGPGWRLHINLGGQPERLGQSDKLKVGDCAAIRDDIVRRLREFRKLPSTLKVLDVDDIFNFASIAEDLEECDDDPDELRAELNELYDEFDFQRVCVAGG